MEYKDLERVNSEIKTVDIKGKNYAEVPKRVTAFRKLFPEGTIETEIISCQNGVCVFKAIAKDGDKVLGTGHAYEKEGSTFINKTSYIENCETSAVGRALGFVGIGIETSIASYEEVQNAKNNQSKPVNNKFDRNAALKRIRELAAEKEISEADVCSIARVKKLEDLEDARLPYCIKYLEDFEDGK